ncbi:MAG: gamma carbonic anhydrase family protein [Acidiferrobacterales bacterium]|nr:gamma carbonic anhydrase family protein [Acidiferrobacterales bacterium]
MAIRAYKGITPTIAASAYVDESAVVIGDVLIGEDSSIWPLCAVRGDTNTIRIGRRSNLQDGSVIHVTHRYEAAPQGYPVVIGDDVTVGHKVLVHGCTIEDRVLIGMGSTLMDGAVIGSEVLLGAGSLVVEGQELEGGYLWMGRPAKRRRALTDEERGWFIYVAKHYAELKNDYLS